MGNEINVATVGSERELHGLERKAKVLNGVGGALGKVTAATGLAVPAFLVLGIAAAVATEFPSISAVAENVNDILRSGAGITAATCLGTFALGAAVESVLIKTEKKIKEITQPGQVASNIQGMRKKFFAAPESTNKPTI